MGLDQFADLLVLERVGGLHGELVALFLTELVGLGPIDEGDRVVGFGIVGVDLDGLVVVLLGIVEALFLEGEVGDSLGGVFVAGIDGEHFFVLFDGLLGVALVFGGLGAGNVLL